MNTDLQKLELYINDYIDNHLPQNVSIQEYLNKMNNFENIEVVPHVYSLKDFFKLPSMQKIIVMVGILIVFILGGIFI